MDEEEDAWRQKMGVELFRELKRLNSMASINDYYEFGIWKEEVLRIDIEILIGHRLEAGAPEPPPLSKVVVGELPIAVAVPRPGVYPNGVVLPPGAIGGVRPVGAVAAQAMLHAAAVAAARAGVPAAVGVPAASPTGVPAVPPAPAPGAAADLRQIALFVSKWRLEPTRTKMLLARLPVVRRRYVMMNFKYAPVEGVSPVAKLEEYIQQCEKTNVWVAAAAAAGLGVVGAGAAVRPPIVIGPDPNKRPRLDPAAIAAAQMAALQQQQAGWTAAVPPSWGAGCPGKGGYGKGKW